MKRTLQYSSLLALVLSIGACQSDKVENFENKAYIPGTSMVTETVIKSNTNAPTKSFVVSLARPADKDYTIGYAVDAAQLATYNKEYRAEATLLPEENYTLPEDKTVKIEKGAVESAPISIDFKDLTSLNRDLVYVLPVSISSSAIELLTTAKTYYFVFKAGALINVVADIEDNYISVNWKDRTQVYNLPQITMEALIRVRNFDQDLSTVMGVEDHFLMRVGDAGFPKNQMQIAAKGDKFPAADASKALPLNKWTHVAVTYNSVTLETIVYVNGKEQSKGVMANIASYARQISLYGGGHPFYIGKSWDDARDLNGEICEARVWKVVRTQEQIASSIYMVDPNTEGLLAYWKFDEGDGTLIKDHSPNGNDAVAAKPLKWTAVELPAK